MVCNTDDGDLIGQCDSTTNCIGQYVQSYFDSLALSYSNPKQKQKYIKLITNNENINTPSKQPKQNHKNNTYGSYIIGFVVLSIMFAFIIYYRNSLNNYKQILIKSLNKQSNGDEYTPLLE